MRYYFSDPKFEQPRLWSNEELSKIAPIVNGSVVNVSAWQDQDKHGATYSEYFSGATEYWITNWEADARGWQGGLKNELYLDLEREIPKDLIEKFDAVFNHTTLEHVFDIFKAFENLCLMSKDIVIIIVPFMQEQHGDYGDYWRLTPWAVKKLFTKNGVIPCYINFNDHKDGSVYVIGVGAKNKTSIVKFKALSGNKVDDVERLFAATGIIRLRGVRKISLFFFNYFKKFYKNKISL